jgi:hypothetical protein
MNLKLLASFGDHIPDSMMKEEETIEHLSFSQCDKFVASGDRAGRVNIYKIRETGRPKNPLSFALAITSQAFTRRFDSILSDEVSPRITSLSWLPRMEFHPRFLASNRVFAL